MHGALYNEPMRAQLPLLILTFVSGTFLVGAAPAAAQQLSEPDVWLQPRESRYDTMMAVKEDITRLIVENKSLEERYSLLKEEWRVRQEQGGDAAAQPVRLPAQQPSPKQPVSKMIIGPEAVRSAGQPAAPVAHRFVKGELMDYNESLDLLELYLADLKYQRRELELELKLRQVELQDRERAAQLQEERIKNELQSALLEERKLIQTLQRRQEELAEAPRNIPRLKKENKVLELEIPALEKKIEVKDREISILKNKMALKEKASDPVLSKLRKEKQGLQAYVDSRNTEYESLAATVSTSLRRQERRKQLIRDIIDFDKENQKLQSQIEELNDKIRYHAY